MLACVRIGEIVEGRLCLSFEMLILMMSFWEGLKPDLSELRCDLICWMIC